MSLSIQQPDGTWRQISPLVHVQPWPEMQPFEIRGEWVVELEPVEDRQDYPEPERIRDPEWDLDFTVDRDKESYAWAQRPVAVSPIRARVLARFAGEARGGFDIEEWTDLGVTRRIHCPGPRLHNNIENELAARYRAATP